MSWEGEGAGGGESGDEKGGMKTQILLRALRLSDVFVNWQLIVC